jgi:hypothetical protein
LRSTVKIQKQNGWNLYPMKITASSNRHINK